MIPRDLIALTILFTCSKMLVVSGAQPTHVIVLYSTVVGAPRHPNVHTVVTSVVYLVGIRVLRATHAAHLDGYVVVLVTDAAQITLVVAELVQTPPAARLERKLASAISAVLTTEYVETVVVTNRTHVAKTSVVNPFVVVE